MLDTIARGQLKIVKRYDDFLVVVSYNLKRSILTLDGLLIYKHIGYLHINSAVILDGYEVYLLILYATNVHVIAMTKQIKINEIFQQIPRSVPIPA